MTERVTARNEVAQQWASRRQENTTPPKSRASQAVVPSLCHVIGKAWQEALANLSHALQPAIASSSSKPNKPPSKRQIGKSSGVFPSVLQILQASALQEQVSQFTTTAQGDNNEALRLLPAGYDWTQAISNMANSRSRAFLLLDLASIVPTLVQWREHCGGSNDSNLQFLYTVQFNADPKLLQLLSRAHVGLVCTNKWDLQNCRELLKDNTSQILYDNASQTGKPDGYLRQLVLDSGVDTVVVDGPEEVDRIVSTLKRMRTRRISSSTDDSKPLNFILRLPNDDEWKELVQSTQDAIARHSQSALTGISVDLSNADQDTTLQAIEDVLQSLQYNNPRLDLTGVEMPPTETMVEWWARLSHKVQITVDVSHSLVSPAGALCTRIIGVKEEPIDGDSTNVRMHYYIDDGCYGSLYNAKEHQAISNPLPLGIEEPATATYTSTVWGPTCDGLDRVCRDIPLPKLHRDQWLVFPELGCRIGEGMGTAFNGFAPPDTAYCVLGYFGK